jgi:hypothetical protein
MVLLEKVVAKFVGQGWVDEQTAASDGKRERETTQPMGFDGSSPNQGEDKK